MIKKTVGILALQGDFDKHAKAIDALGAAPHLIRYPEDLKGCDACILPGGESTTLSRAIDFIGLREPLIAFAESKPLFGTCAGLILLAKNVQDPSVKTLELLDIEVSRNGYGPQYESFSAEIALSIDKSREPFHAIFIRGPRIQAVGPEVKVLAYFQKEPILVQQGYHLAATFHPELTKDLRIHRHLLKMD